VTAENANIANGNVHRRTVCALCPIRLASLSPSRNIVYPALPIRDNLNFISSYMAAPVSLTGSPLFQHAAWPLITRQKMRGV
jgi:hypothetical protein